MTEQEQLEREVISAVKKGLPVMSVLKKYCWLRDDDVFLPIHPMNRFESNGKTESASMNGQEYIRGYLEAQAGVLAAGYAPVKEIEL